MERSAVNEAIAAVEEAMKASGAVPEAMEAFAIEKSKLLQSMEASASKIVMKPYKNFDSVDCGDYFEILPKGFVINKNGELGLAWKESHLKDMILLSGVPQIVLKCPRDIPQTVTVIGLQTQLMKHVRKAINEAPEPIRVAFRKAYMKAKEEFEKGVRNQPGQIEAHDVDEATNPNVKGTSGEGIEVITEALEQINVDSYSEANEKGVRNQTAQVDTLDVDQATMPSFMGTFEKDPEHTRACAQMRAEKLIKADQISVEKMAASYREACGKLVRNQTGQVNAHGVDQETVLGVEGAFEQIRSSYRDEARIRLLQAMADKIIRAQQIRAQHFRAIYGVADDKGVGNQTGQVDADDVDYASVLNFSFKDNLPPP